MVEKVANFDAEQICNGTFVVDARVFDELDSTNNFAVELASSPELKTPALVVAATQTAGRGRRGNRWHSPRGALLFSLIVDHAAERIAVSLAIASAVADAVDELLRKPQAKIKWPNDVYVDDEKLAGVLIETPHCAKGPPRQVIGVGVNVNNGADVPHAISLCELANREFDLQRTLVRILHAIHPRLSMPAESAFPGVNLPINRDYLSGRTVEINVGNQSIAAQCQGVAADGGLSITDDQGVSHRIYSGTITAVL